jgi:hypothetical protein
LSTIFLSVSSTQPTVFFSFLSLFSFVSSLPYLCSSFPPSHPLPRSRLPQRRPPLLRSRLRALRAHGGRGVRDGDDANPRGRAPDKDELG